MSRLKGLVRYGVGVSTLAMALMSPVAAQETPADAGEPATEAADDSVVPEIIVTSQKREENVQDVSATVQALSGEDLAAAGINDVSRLEQLAPGMVFAKGGNDAKIAIRGANSNSTFADNTSIVGVFVDGVYKPRASQQSRAFFDVARLEVLRGPQGTLYGRNTLGGAINLYSNGPDLSEPGLSFSLDSTFSRFNRLRNEFVANGTVNDRFGVRLAVLTDHSDGWVENLIGRNLGIADTFSFRASAKLLATDDIDFVLRVSRIAENGNPAGMFAIQGACRTVTTNGLTDPFGPVLDCQNPRRGSGGTPRFDLIDGTAGVSNRDLRTVQRDFVHDDRLRETNVTLEGNFDFGPIALKSTSAYNNYTSLLGNDADYSANAHHREWVEENNKSYSQELQFLSQWDGPVQATFGGYASHDKLFFSYSQFRHTVDNLAARPMVLSTNGVSLPVLIGTPLVSLNTQINSASNNTQFIESDYRGVFGEITFSVLDQLRLIAGARYNHEVKEAVNGNAAYIGSLMPAVVPTSPQEVFAYNPATATATSNVRATFNNTTYRFGAEYDVNQDVMLYGTYSTGFLSGVMNQNGTVTQPQKSRSYELGLKGRFVDGRVQANLSLYDVRYTELATTFQIPNPNNIGQFITLSSNGGTLKAQGAELAVATRPINNLDLSFGASYMHAEYGQFGINLPGGFQVINGAVPASRFVDLRGQRPPYTPKFTFSAAASYDIDIGVGYITPKVQFRYSDSYFAHGGLPFDISGFQESFTQTDLRIGYEPYNERWGVEAFVENLEDEMLNQRTQTGGDGLQQANYGMPRIYGVRLKLNL